MRVPLTVDDEEEEEEEEEPSDDDLPPAEPPRRERRRKRGSGRPEGGEAGLRASAVPFPASRSPSGRGAPSRLDGERDHRPSAERGKEHGPRGQRPSGHVTERKKRVTSAGSGPPPGTPPLAAPAPSPESIRAGAGAEPDGTRGPGPPRPGGDPPAVAPGRESPDGAGGRSPGSREAGAARTEGFPGWPGPRATGRRAGSRPGPVSDDGGAGGDAEPGGRLPSGETPPRRVPGGGSPGPRRAGGDGSRRTYVVSGREGAPGLLPEPSGGPRPEVTERATGQGSQPRGRSAVRRRTYVVEKPAGPVPEARAGPGTGPPRPALSGEGRTGPSKGGRARPGAAGKPVGPRGSRKTPASPSGTEALWDDGVGEPGGPGGLPRGPGGEDGSSRPRAEAVPSHVGASGLDACRKGPAPRRKRPEGAGPGAAGERPGSGGGAGRGGRAESQSGKTYVVVVARPGGPSGAGGGGPDPAAGWGRPAGWQLGEVAETVKVEPVGFPDEAGTVDDESGFEPPPTFSRKIPPPAGPRPGASGAAGREAPTGSAPAKPPGLRATDVELSPRKRRGTMAEPIVKAEPVTPIPGSHALQDLTNTSFVPHPVSPTSPRGSDADPSPLLTRRKRPAVCYTEPKLTGKLRRGDDFTDSMFLHSPIFKSKKSKHKNTKKQKELKS
ncbi:shugoshin 2 isoform X2 [Ornithorhynchus anatinus]|nr:shugoshin 2 isoform X2 [Ornithorhynchus anatinus]